jgi:3-oxoacyl-[acyl-carrier protein] reductase
MSTISSSPRAPTHDFTTVGAGVASAAGLVCPDLAGKIAVVTGGSRGIGAATAAALARNGAAVAAVGRDRTALDQVVARIGADGGTSIGLLADATKEDDLAALHTEVGARLGPVDILAAFAGGDGMPVPTISETPAHWRAVIDSELTATFLTISAFLPDLLGGRGGVIITMASAAARQAAQSAAAYAGGKAGVIALTRHLAKELAGEGIRVNCLAPSAIENEKMRTRMPQDARAALGEAFPLGRIGQPDDVANATLFLASEASSWITGVTLDVAGGKIML